MTSTRPTGLVPTPGTKQTLPIISLLGWTFGLAALAAGLVNCFFGNDPYFGVFISVLSLGFFPPVTNLVHRFLGIRVPSPIMFLLALFIIWVTLGVGELFQKIDIMMEQLR